MNLIPYLTGKIDLYSRKLSFSCYSSLEPHVPMNIRVHLHTILERKTDSGGTIGQLDLFFHEGITMNDLLKHLEIKLEPDNMLLVVNGRIVELDHKIRDGDEINLIPAMSGG